MVIIQLIISFLISFFNQKGKNSADKDDVTKLTQLVEEVNSQFSQENEHLKAALSIFVDKRNKSYTQEQQAIIAFYTEVNTWIWEKTKILIHEYGFNDIDKLNQKIIEMDQCHNRVNIYNGSMDLLVNDAILTQKGYDLIIEVLKLHQFVENKCRNLKTALVGEAIYAPMVDKYGELSELMKNHVFNNVKKFEADKDEAVKNFYDQRTELLKPIFNKLHEFKNLAKLYLLN
jgi:hypothetical protein